MIEAAFIAPLLFLILFGILEYGLLFRDYLTVGDATADAAKQGSIQGPLLLGANQSADYTIASTLRQDLASVPTAWLSAFVVFKSGAPAVGGPLAQFPAACKNTNTSVPASKCNVYPAFDAFYAVQTANTGYFRCITAGDRACAWNPETRINGPKIYLIEYLGVYVHLTRKQVTGLFGKTYDLEVAAVQRLEPGQLT